DKRVLDIEDGQERPRELRIPAKGQRAHAQRQGRPGQSSQAAGERRVAVDQSELPILGQVGGVAMFGWRTEHRKPVGWGHDHRAITVGLEALAERADRRCARWMYGVERRVKVVVALK